MLIFKPKKSGAVQNTSDNDKVLDYVLLQKILTKDEICYLADGYIFLVNLSTYEVICSIKDSYLYVNRNLTDKAIIYEISDVLKRDFIILSEDFVLDSETKVIYVGQAAIDYRQSIVNHNWLH